MRFFEITEPNTPPAPQAGVPPVDATKEPHPADKQPVAPTQLKAKVKRKGDGPFVINGVTYANRTDQDAEVAAIKAALIDEFPSVNVRNDLEDLNDGKKIPSIRILNALPRDKVLSVLKDAGYQLTNTKNVIKPDLSKLEKKLEEYLSVEDYEMASQLRDKINQIKNLS